MKKSLLFMSVLMMGVFVLGFVGIAKASTTNLALGGTATQSSTDYGGPASRAIDGNVDGAFYNGSVSHTGFEDHPWWQVDLGNVYNISQINIWNRTDCCSNRLHDFDVEVLDNTGGIVWQQLFASFTQNLTNGAGTSGMSIDLPADIKGNIVKVVDGPDYLQLAEVQVFGSAVPIPASIWLIGSGLFGLIGLKRRYLSS